MKVKTINLFGRPVFNLVTIQDIVHMPTPMPEDEAAFVYVLEGECISYSEVEEINIRTNQAVLAKCGNSTFRTLKVGNSLKYCALTVKFHKDILDELYENSSTPLMPPKEHPLLVNSTKLEVNKIINQYINGLVSYFENTSFLSEDLLVLKLKELIVLLLQTKNAPNVLGIMNNLYEKKVFKFKEIIKSHICSSLSINELAQLTNHSLSSFKKEFNRIYNDTPNNYLIARRIELVAKSLITTDSSISNIAYDCRFKTLAHMSRVFKTKYGMSPTKYRQNFLDKQ